MKLKKKEDIITNRKEKTTKNRNITLKMNNEDDDYTTVEDIRIKKEKNIENIKTSSEQKIEQAFCFDFESYYKSSDYSETDNKLKAMIKIAKITKAMKL